MNRGGSMNLPTIIVLSILSIVIVIAAKKVKKDGTCQCDCSSCGKSCAYIKDNNLKK